MPMTILFIGFIFFLLIHKIEVSKHPTQTNKPQNKTERRPLALPLALLALSATLMAIEWHLYIKGDIYQKGIGLIGFIKLGLLITLGSISLYIKNKTTTNPKSSPLLSKLPTYGLAAAIALTIFVH